MYGIYFFFHNVIDYFLIVTFLYTLSSHSSILGKNKNFQINESNG